MKLSLMPTASCPEARGRAQRMLEESNAYRDQVIARAQGEAQRFEQLLAEYEKAPDVTRERLYIDTVQTVFANTNKVMVDVDGGNNVLYLPLDKMVPNAGQATKRHWPRWGERARYARDCRSGD